MVKSKPKNTPAMPAQTRSRGKAPPSRVYHSTPAPAQLEFPRRRKVVKTYARQPQSARSLRQQTLTQIGYVDPIEPQQLDMASSPEERPQKRRKTMGDTPSSSFHTQTLTQLLSTAGDDEGTLLLNDSDVDDNDEPGEAKTRGKRKAQVPKKALSHVTDSRATSMIPQTPVHRKTKTNIWEVPSSQPTPTTPLEDIERFRIPPLRSPLQEKTTNIKAPLPTSGTITKRPPDMVIADSYSSAPGLPSSDPAQPSSDPAQPSSDPAQCPFKTPLLPYLSQSASRPRASVELGESLHGRKPAPGRNPVAGPSAPSTRPPLREIGVFEIPDSDDELQSLGPSPLKSVGGVSLPPTPLRITRLAPDLPERTPVKIATEAGDREVASSDQESDPDPGSPTPVARKLYSNPRASHRKQDVLQSAPLASISSQAPKDKAGLTPTPLSRNKQADAPEALEGLEDDVLAGTPFTSQISAITSQPSHNTRSRKSQMEAPEVHEDEVLPGTPFASRKSPLASQSSHNTRSRKVQMDMTQDTPDDDVHGDTPQAKSQFYTQGLESQRVPLEVIRAMAPQTDRSDIIVSIHPEPADLIANGSKNHEFRNYKIPNTVSRIWIYITRPICELRYMATIGPAKQPGAIDDDSGVGNREFNAQAGNYKYKFAYELLQVYQLNNPVSLEMMKEKGWVESPPQKYVYIPPAVVGQLLGNLRCALFDDGPQSDQEESHRILSTPQEIEDQLRSDIIHSTQMQSEVSVHNEIVLSSQDESSKGQQTPTAKTTSDNVSARPQLPATRTPASARRMPSLPAQPSLPTLPSRKEANAVRPSQATTASEPSSPVISPDKSIPRPVLGSSGPSFPDYGDSESPVRVLNMQQYSLGSSQIRLPESLLVDDVRPPPVVWDSDEEDSDGQLA